MAQTQVIKAVQYVRKGSNGSLVPVFPMTTADHVYTDITKQTTVADALVGGMVSPGAYAYHNIYGTHYDGSNTGAMKVQLPVGLDGLDIDAELDVSGISGEIFTDLCTYNVDEGFTRNTSTRTMTTTVSEIDYTGDFLFTAVYDGSSISEYALYQTDRAVVTKTNMVEDLPSRPIQAIFTQDNNFLIILCTENICVYLKTNNVFNLTATYSRALPTALATMSPDNIGSIIYNDKAYIIATSSIVGVNMEFYEISADGTTLTRSTDMTVPGGGYTGNGKITVYSRTIFITYQSGVTPVDEGSLPIYAVDALRLTLATGVFIVNRSILINKSPRVVEVSRYGPYIVDKQNNITISQFMESTGTVNQLNIISLQTSSDIIRSIDRFIGFAFIHPIVSNQNINFIAYGTISGDYAAFVRVTWSPQNGATFYSAPITSNTQIALLSDVLTHTSNGYVYAITETNIYGTNILPYNIIGNTTTHIVSQPSQNFPTINISKFDLNAAGTRFLSMDSDTKAFQQHVLVDGTSNNYRIVYMNNMPLSTGADIKFVGNDHIALLSGPSENVILYIGYGGIANVTSGKRVIAISYTKSGKLYVSDTYKDNSGYYIIIVGNEVDGYAIHVIQITGTTTAVNLTVAGVTTIPAGAKNFIFLRNSITDGFFFIANNNIRHYTVSISGTTATIANGVTISPVGYSLGGYQIDTGVLCNDNATMLFKHSSNDHIVAIKWDTTVTPNVFIESFPTVSGIENFTGGSSYHMDYLHNELVMVHDGKIIKFGFVGSNLEYAGSYSSIPELRSDSKICMSEDGSVLYGNTNVGSNSTNPGKFDYGTFLFRTDNTITSTKVKLSGHLDTSGWTNYNISVNGIYLNDLVSLGYDSTTGRGCILIGNTDSTWLNAAVNIRYINISGSITGHDDDIATRYYTTGYSTAFLSTLTNIIHRTSQPDPVLIPYIQRIKTSIVAINPSSWEIDENYGYSYKYYHPNITTNSTVNVNIADVPSLNIANIANVHSITLENSGYVTIFAANRPEGMISASFEIIN